MSLQVDAGISLQREVPLKTFSTFKIGGPALFLAEPSTIEELRSLLEFQRREGLRMMVIGRGSNILFGDERFEGLVVCLRQFESQSLAVEEGQWIRTSAGVSLAKLSEFALANELSGIEFLCHIPGCVGGAVAMNAGFGRRGGQWRQMQDVVDSVTTLNSASGAMSVLAAADVGFEYRQTHLSKDLIILGTRLRLTRGRREAIGREMEANFTYRNGVQDLSHPSAGSVFKNPKDSSVSSGQLLDRAKMKGMRIGDAMVSEKHANFILNLGQAKARDVLDLIKIARKRVLDQFGIKLDLELKYAGSDKLD